MPPKPRITREMILDAAYAIVCEAGMEQLNARAIADRLDCSTQPVLYHFRHVDDIRQEIYRRADEMHSEFLMQLTGDANPMIQLGLNYILFAVQQKHLFRLLFQSDGFADQSITDLIDMPEIVPLLELFQHEAQLNLAQTKTVFRTLLMLVHGCASMLANNSMCYDENEITQMLESAFTGMMAAMKMGENTNEKAL